MSYGGPIPGVYGETAGGVRVPQTVLRVDPRPTVLSGPVPAPRVRDSSGDVVVPQGAPLTTRAVVPVCPPQVQATGSGVGDLEVPVSAGEVMGPDGSDQQCLQQLRDSQRWAEHQQAVLRVQAPVFVPGAVRAVIYKR